MDLDTYHDTGNTCLGGGGRMHCPSASSLKYFLFFCYILSKIIVHAMKHGKIIHRKYYFGLHKNNANLYQKERMVQLYSLSLSLFPCTILTHFNIITQVKNSATLNRTVMVTSV